jgi:hypothetical protein
MPKRRRKLQIQKIFLSISHNFCFEIPDSRHILNFAPGASGYHSKSNFSHLDPLHNWLYLFSEPSQSQMLETEGFDTSPIKCAFCL